MDNTWDEILEGLDWNAIDRETQKELEEERVYDELYDYFDDDSFDYKRSYLRKFMRTYPKITDRNVIDIATEQMLESHEGGVELDVKDALRFAERKKIPSVKELVKMLTDAGINDGNIDDLLDVMLSPDFEDDGKRGTIKDPAVKRRAGLMMRYAYILERNKDVLILGLPTYDNASDWTQIKIAFFGEDLNSSEKTALNQLIKLADKSGLTQERGVAVAFFQIYNIWSDFK